MTGRHGAHGSYNEKPENLAEAIAEASTAAGIDQPTARRFLAAWLRAYSGPKRMRPLKATADIVEALA